MILPKYKFYVGQAFYTAFYEGFLIDKQNGLEVENSQYCSSAEINVDLLASYFLNLSSTSYKHIYAACYNKAGSYIGSVEANKEGILNLKDGTNLIRLSFNISGVQDGYNKFKSAIPFVYKLFSVNPHYKDLSKKYSKESGQEFFRISLDGKINLFGQDYDIVKNSSLEDQLIFMISKYNEASKEWVEYYKGEFNKTDCKFDDSKLKCELKTSAIDEYSEIMNKYENTYDLIKLTPAITKINAHKRSLMQVYIRGSNSITNFFGGTYWEDDVNEVIDDHNTLINTFRFAYLKAGNEFYVNNAGIAEVNGVYAGTNGVFSQWNGHTAFIDYKPDSITHKIYIKRNSDNTVLYESVKSYVVPDPNNMFIGREDIEMINVNNPNDTFIIESPFVYHIYRRLLCDVESVTTSDGQIIATHPLPSNDFVSDNRNYKRCIGLVGGLFFCTSRTVDEPTRYGLNDFGKYFTNKFIPSTTGLGRALPISRNSWVNASLWYVYDDYTYSTLEKNLRKKYTIKDTYSLGDTIKALLSKIDPTIKHENSYEYSHFLYGNDGPQKNSFSVYISQKTNILKGDYDQPAQKAEISLEELMKMLRDCFRCYWYVEDGKFKIEHISFFMNGGSYNTSAAVQLDFTSLTDQFNKKPSAYFQSEIEYDKSDLNSRYEFGWMDDVTEFFGGVTIDVVSNYIQKDKSEEINVGQFSSDIDYMLFNPSNFSEDGFALLCPILKNGEYELPIVESQLVDEGGDTYRVISQNWYASWAYLVRFYMYDMPANSIKCNVLRDLAVNSIKSCMKHSIEFSAEEDLNILKLIKTKIGNGQINEISINLNTRLSKAKLIYKPT